jgi:hypothetical protein
MTNNKSEDSLRKQEWSKPKVGFLRQFLNESLDWKGKMWTDEEILKFIDIATPKVATKEERKDFTYSVMPSKVATSEKECKHEIYEYPEQHCFFCKKCGIAHGTRELFFVDTPHESEDIELSLEYLVKDFFQSIQGSTSDWQERRLMEFIESEKSKSYQRGREEGYTEGIEKCAFDEVEIEKSSLSLAVQEIEKEKRKITICSEEDYKNGTSCNNCESGLSECTNASKDKEHNQGLDKAKEIISGLKSKE